MADFTVSTEIDDFMQSSDKAAMRTNMDLGTSAIKNAPATGDAAAGEVVLGNDTRLTDARTPTSHTHTASEVTDFDTEVSNNSTVAANASKLAGIEAGAEVNNISDVNATDLTDGGDSTLHYHSADRARANHTGTQTLSTISDAGTIASQDANSVTITGGSVTGITDLAIADGGTGAGTAAGARTNLEVYSTSEVDSYLGPKATAGGVRMTTGTAGGSTGYELGTADFTLSGVVELADYTPAAAITIWQSHDAGDNRVQLQIQTDGDWRLIFTDSGSTATNYDLVPTGLTNGTLYHFAITADRDGNAQLYIDGNANGSAVSISGNSADDIGDGNANGFEFAQILRDLAIFNRALTATEVETLYRNGLAGIADADRWGETVISPTFRNGGFETTGGGGADVFADWGETIIGSSTISQETVDTYSGSGALKIVTDGSNNNAYVNQSGLIEIGKTYRISFWGKGGGTATNEIVGIYIGGTSPAAAAFTLTTSWAYYEREIVAAQSGINVGRFFTGDAGQTLLIDDLKIERLGCIAAYPMDEGIGYQLHDISSNHYDGLLSTTGFTHLVPKTEGYIREYGVDMYGSVVGLVDSSRSILPEDALITRASLINQNNATVSGSLYAYRMSGALTDQINNFSTSMAAVPSRYMNTFTQDGIEQDNTYRNVGVRSYDTDATNIDIRVDYEVL